MIEHKCMNCHRETVGDDVQYCHYCGQSTVKLNQSFKNVSIRAFHELFDIDGRVIKTLRAILTKPGFLSKEYCGEKRQRYTPPLRMYLVFSVVFFLSVELIQTSPSKTHDQIGIFLLPLGIIDQLPRLMFIMLPVFAGLIQLVFRNTFYIHNLVFSLHIHSFNYFILTLALLMQSVIKHDGVVAIVILSLLLTLPVYLYISIKRFFNQSWQRTIIKSTIIATLYLSCLSVGMELVKRYF